MKSYEETIASVFDKMETYRANQKRKRKIVLSAVIPVCLMAVCITGLWIYQAQKADTPNYSLESPTAPVSMDSAVLSTSPVDTDPVTAPAEKIDRIIINPMGDVSEQRMDIALHTQDEVFMTLEEICEYYGTDIVPEVPENLTRWGNENYRIFKRDNGTGEIYWDQNIQQFSNEDFSRHIYVETAKGRLPFHCCVIYEPENESAVINGVEVAIGLSEYGYYGVWFMYHNTGFCIFAEGVTEEELVNVIRSLTD